MSGKPGRSGPPGHRRREVHGLGTMRRALVELGSRAFLDGRTRIAKALAAWRSDLVADLGGPEALSTQRALLVDLVVKQKLLVDSIDAWLLARSESLIDGEKALLPVVRERQALADGLARYLAALGLERREPEPRSLAAYLAERYGGVGDDHDRDHGGGDHGGGGHEREANQ